MNISNTLNKIKKSIREANISMSEIAFLQSHKQSVLDMGDIELAEWAGITESEWNKKELEEL